MALIPPPTAREREHLARAKRRLDTLTLYPDPVRMGRVRIVSVPWLFAMSYLRGYRENPHEVEAREAVAATREVR